MAVERKLPERLERHPILGSLGEELEKHQHLTPVKILLNLEKEKAKGNPELEWMDNDELRAVAFAVNRILEEEGLSEKEKELAAAHPVFDPWLLTKAVEDDKDEVYEALGTGLLSAAGAFKNKDLDYARVDISPVKRNQEAYLKIVKTAQEGKRAVNIRGKLKDPELESAVIRLELLRALKEIKGIAIQEVVEDIGNSDHIPYPYYGRIGMKVLRAMNPVLHILQKANTPEAEEYLKKWEELRKSTLEKTAKGHKLSDKEKREIIELKKALENALEQALPEYKYIDWNQETSTLLRTLEHVHRVTTDLSSSYTVKGVAFSTGSAEVVEKNLRKLIRSVKKYSKAKNGKVSWEDVVEHKLQMKKKELKKKKIDENFAREYAKRVLEEMKNYIKERKV